MKERQKLSDELINAFLDDELTPEEKAQVYERLADNEQLNQEVCGLGKVRDLVELAYREPPMPDSGKINNFTTHRKYGIGLAAGLALLMIGGAGGWYLHQSNAPLENLSAQVTIESQGVAKVLFHVSDGNAEHLRSVLDEVEDLMKFYRRTHQKSRVEVITNGGGLTLVMDGFSPFAERIKQMQKNYSDLTFVACQNTIDRVEQQLGISAKLLPDVIVIDSGVAQIMRRQHQGWAYIQV